MQHQILVTFTYSKLYVMCVAHLTMEDVGNHCWQVEIHCK